MQTKWKKIKKYFLFFSLILILSSNCFATVISSRFKITESEYTNGFKYMMVEFKKKQRLVMRTFLFNDIEFIGINSDESIPSDNPLFSNYHILNL